MSQHLKTLWGRAGVSFHITDEEAEAILGDNADGTEIAKTMQKIVAEGRYEMDGNSYIPADCVTVFNRRYGTDFCDNDEPEWGF